MVWTLLIVFILILLAFDLLVLHRKGEAPTNRRAAIESSFLVTIALSFSIAVYFIYRDGMIDNPESLTANDAVLKYISGYLIELSLSVDNLFVIAMIFKSYTRSWIKHTQNTYSSVNSKSSSSVACFTKVSL